MNRREWKQAKYKFCLRQIRELTEHYTETKDRRYLAMRTEAIADARYWKREMTT